MSSIFFAFNLLFTVLSFSFAFAICIFIPLTIYLIPFSFWCGTFKGKKYNQDLKKQSIFKTIKNASILYSSWILKKEPKF